MAEYLDGFKMMCSDNVKNHRLSSFSIWLMFILSFGYDSLGYSLSAIWWYGEFLDFFRKQEVVSFVLRPDILPRVGAWTICALEIYFTWIGDHLREFECWTYRNQGYLSVFHLNIHTQNQIFIFIEFSSYFNFNLP